MTWIIFILWFILYNQYFGWNFFPKSDAELICDGVSLLLFVVAWENTFD